jgi:hypothetical protein
MPMIPKNIRMTPFYRSNRWMPSGWRKTSSATKGYAFD